MTVRHLPLVLCAFSMLSAPVSAASAPATQPPDSQPPAQKGAVRVIVETIAVDRRGTWSAGTDEADIFPGSSGVLTRSATLMGREARNAPREMVEITVHIAAETAKDGLCNLQIRSEAKSVVAGARAGKGNAPGERRSATLPLRKDEEKLMEVYSSTVTQGRLTLKVRCAEPALGAPAADPEFIDFVLSIDRGEGDGQAEPLKSNRLRAALGREASDLFSFNVPLPEDDKEGKRYRREQLEIALTPQLISGDKLQLEVSARGELATVSANTVPVTHPIERREIAVLKPGETHDLTIEVTSSGEREGWARVRYVFHVLARF